MSYSIAISGHKATSSDEESVAFEEKVLADIKEAMRRKLDSVTYASGSFGHIGQRDILAEVRGEPAAEPSPGG